MAYIEIQSKSNSHISAYVAGLSSGYTDPNPPRTIIWYMNEMYYGTYTIPNGSTQSYTYDFNSLSPNTTYRIMATVKWYNADGSLAGSTDVYAEIATDPIGSGGGGGASRPPYFYWTYPKTSGGQFNLTAAEWNGLMSNINEVRSYLGYSPWGFTFVAPGYYFTADHYNACVYAIRHMIGSYYGTLVNSGDPVTAALLNELQYLINSIG